MKQCIEAKYVESVQDVYSFNNDFMIHFSDLTGQPVISSNIRYYKIGLYIEDPTIEKKGDGMDGYSTSLFFGPSTMPYPWKNNNEGIAYCCFFTEEFLRTNNNTKSLQQSPLFKTGERPLFLLNNQQARYTVEIFKKMFDAYNLDYLYKHDLIRNYINLIVHEVLQMLSPEHFTKPVSAIRVVTHFFELLERQFPVESPSNPLPLRNATDFANALSVHVNHLNRSVRQSTGKSTTAHITERIIREAKFLLRYTKWPISHIAFSLGFEYPTYFNNYFKKQAGITPTVFRSG